MKTIDDALELRARIFSAFEQAEIATDPAEIQRLLTFVVVGAGPTGVEMAGQIRELASKTLKGEFRQIDPTQARVILVDGAPYPLPPFGEKLGQKTRSELEKLGVEMKMDAFVTNVDADGVTLKYKSGEEETIESVCKVWAAGVSASPLGAQLAKATGAQVDRSGRVEVNKDLTGGSGSCSGRHSIGAFRCRHRTSTPIRSRTQAHRVLLFRQGLNGDDRTFQSGRPNG